MAGTIPDWPRAQGSLLRGQSVCRWHCSCRSFMSITSWPDARSVPRWTCFLCCYMGCSWCCWSDSLIARLHKQHWRNKLRRCGAKTPENKREKLGQAQFLYFNLQLFFGKFLRASAEGCSTAPCTPLPVYAQGKAPFCTCWITLFQHLCFSMWVLRLILPLFLFSHLLQEGSAGLCLRGLVWRVAMA